MGYLSCSIGVFSSHSSADREADMLQPSLSLFVCLRFTLINVKPRLLIQKAPPCLLIKEAINAQQTSLPTWAQSAAELRPVIIYLRHWWKRPRPSEEPGGAGRRRGVSSSEGSWGRPKRSQPTHLTPTPPSQTEALRQRLLFLPLLRLLGQKKH